MIDLRQLKTRATDVIVLVALFVLIAVIGYLGWTWVAHIHACP